MKFRDISLRKRLLFTNFTMMIVPVLFLFLIGMMVSWGIRATGPAKVNELAMLWPEKGQSLSIQFAVSSLRVKLEQEHGRGMMMERNIEEGNHHNRRMAGMMMSQGYLQELREDCQVLESQGIGTAIIYRGQLAYITPEENPNILLDDVKRRCGNNQSAYLWDANGFYFQYASRNGNIVVLGRGNVPYQGGEIPINDAKHVIEGLILLVIGIVIIFIIFLGRYIARLLSRQILEPLAELRNAAEAIKQGNFDVPINTAGKDELGETCIAFDQMRQELKKARKLQEKYEQSRKELIADISHDLSTPLTSVKGYASGILDGIAKTPEKQRHYLERIQQTACNMEKLVESLSLFSKLDLGKMSFNFEAVNIYLYLSDYADEVRNIYFQQGMELNFISDDNMNQAIVMLDRIQFQRVIENLLSNSIKYNNRDNVEKYSSENDILKVNIRLENKNSNIMITFEDNGIGVKDEDLPRLFDRFYRTDTARTNVFKGSGLGLSIVKRIIEEMQGMVYAEKSRLGGLSVCIILPYGENFKFDGKNND